MKRPDPAEFDLTSEQAEEIPRHLRRFKNRLLPLGVATSLGVSILSVGPLLNWDLPASISDWFGMFLLLFVAFATVGLLAGSAGVMVIGEFVWRKLHPETARYEAYQQSQLEYRAWALRATVAFWEQIDPLAFERELAELFRAQGYHAALTPRTGDQGIDILLRRNGNITVVQCKATRTPVGPAVARELYGAMLAVGAPRAILACPAGFTAGTRGFVQNKPIELLDLNRIMELQVTVELAMRRKTS